MNKYNQKPDVGKLGEELVARWLNQNHWSILHRRWRCRWGEIDIIGKSEAVKQRQDLLVFVEVKTRSRGNWDADGLLAITPSKQGKMRCSAELFLADNPAVQNLPCRFDVALVSCQRLCPSSHHAQNSLLDLSVAIDSTIPIPSLQLGKSVFWAGYQFILQDYIQSAFD
ncbi:MAG: YraN family protein [Symploca sp. SIO2E9]|nr:YraN family protein [Symploca sp. SIO2E9]